MFWVIDLNVLLIMHLILLVKNIMLWLKSNILHYNQGNARIEDIHSPFNRIKDYDYKNDKILFSNLENWTYYSNIKKSKKI